LINSDFRRFFTSFAIVSLTFYRFSFLINAAAQNLKRFKMNVIQGTHSNMYIFGS